MEKNTYKYSYKVENQLLSSLSVYNVGYQKCEPGYLWGPGVRNHYLIHHVIAGKGHYDVNGVIYDLKAGDTFLVYPGTEVRYYAHSQDPWEYVWVGFAGNDALSILENTDFAPQSPILEQASRSREIKAGILSIYEARGNSFEDAVSMTGALYSMLALLMNASAKGEHPAVSQSDYVDRAIRYIHERYSYPITVEDIAHYVGISRSYLFRKFQGKTGQSPKDYLDSYRLKHAGQLLRETDLSITAIAYSVGFENNLYFSKAFRKYTGTSPSEYRKSKK